MFHIFTTANLLVTLLCDVEAVVLGCYWSYLTSGGAEFFAINISFNDYIHVMEFYL